MKKFDNSVKGVCEWACYTSKLSFKRLRPQDVTLYLKDGRTIDYAQADMATYTGEDILSIKFTHPDAVEPVTIEVGVRQ